MSFVSDIQPWYALRDEFRKGWAFGECGSKCKHYCFCLDIDKAMTKVAADLVQAECLKRHKERMNDHA